MAQNTYEGTIRLPNGNSQKITVQADSPDNARAMIAAQYGKGALIGNYVTQKR